MRAEDAIYLCVAELTGGTGAEDPQRRGNGRFRAEGRVVRSMRAQAIRGVASALGIVAAGCLIGSGGEDGISSVSDGVGLASQRFARAMDENRNFGLSWSPSGDNVVFVSNKGDSWGIWTVGRNGQNPRLLVSDDVRGATPAWSPDGNEIVFETSRQSQFVNLWIMDREGGHVRQVTDDRENQNFLPRWSPDGGAFAYVSLSMEPPQQWILWLRERNGSRTRILAMEKYILPNFSWSPDGTRIAFASTRSGNWDIWIVDREGDQLKQLTTEKAGEEQPTWSPDGGWLAFVSDQSGHEQIWMMDAEGRHRRQLTHDRGNDHHPAWSPDGRKIAFLSDRSGHDEVWIMDRDGRRQTALTHGPARHDIVKWSPDGQQVAFIAYQHGTSDVGILNVESRE